MKLPLTDRRIAQIAAPAPGLRLEIFDRTLPALVVRVTHRGAKTFCVRYRMGCRTLRYTIGKPGQLKVRDARRIAMQVLVEVAQGSDPMQTRRHDRRRQRELLPPLSVSTAINRYVREWLPRRVGEGGLKPAYAAECARLLQKEVATRWSKKILGDVTALEITNLLSDVSANSTRRHTYFALRALCKWAEGAGLLARSPIPANYPNPTKPKERDRVLTENETCRIWKHVHRATCSFHAIVALLFLTGQRRDEVADAEWREFDLTARTWTIPGDRVKNGRLHIIPLSAPAIELLRSLPSQESRYLFPGRGVKRATFSGWSRSKEKLDHQIEVTDWTLHDLRRTVATRLSERGVSPHVVERLLNHTSGTVSGVAAVYNRASYHDDVANAVNLWSEYLGALLKK